MPVDLDTLDASAQMFGLGDLTAKFFETFGVTEERYRAAKSAIGLEPTCSCDSLKKWLNALGVSVGVNDAANKLAAWLKTKKGSNDGE